jgi:hypothetical protein
MKINKDTSIQKLKIFYPAVVKGISANDLSKSLLASDRLINRGLTAYKNQLFKNRVKPKERKRHVIETIVEYSTLGKNTLPLSVFGYPYEELNLLTSYLEKLKQKGCFESWHTNPFKSVIDGEIIFTGLNMRTLTNLLKLGNLDSDDDTEVLYWLKHSMTGELVINGKYILASTNEDSDNDILVGALLDKANTFVSYSTITANGSKAITRPINNILYDLGFRKELRKLFIRVRKNQVRLNNPVTQNIFSRLALDEAVLESALSKLPTL